MDEKEIDTRDLIIDTYLNILKQKQSLPVASDFVESGIKRGKIRHHFGGIEKLHEYMSKHHNEQVSQYFASIDDVFRRDKMLVKNTFVITTAVADAKADLEFLESLKSYCEVNDAQIMILPCESVTNSFENRNATFDREFRKDEYTFVVDDTMLNNNLMLGSIQVSAKQIKPTTGLQRVGKRDGSFIFASPKQFLDYLPSGNDLVKNHAIMTPGACTKPYYYTDTFVSKRLSYIADSDHTIGAIIVEIEDDETFHFRQIQAAGDGSFIDLGTEYRPDGTTKPVPVHVVLGDVHGVQVDWKCLYSFFNFTAFANLNVKSVFLHDIFDGNSVNHHIDTIAEKTSRHMLSMDSLVGELKETWKVMETIRQFLDPEDVYVVRSNHDEFLDRYLKEGRYIDDPVNHYDALKIAPALFENDIPLRRGLEMVVGEEVDRYTFLDRRSDIRVGGVHVSSHGDMGMNGAKSSLNTLEKIYGDCVTAHVHSAAIQRGVFRVGTFTKLDMGYNRGPGSWTQTACLVYENGQRQLVNHVEGHFCKNQSTYSEMGDSEVSADV